MVTAPKTGGGYRDHMESVRADRVCMRSFDLGSPSFVRISCCHASWRYELPLLRNVGSWRRLLMRMSVLVDAILGLVLVTLQACYQGHNNYNCFSQAPIPRPSRMHPNYPSSQEDNMRFGCLLHSLVNSSDPVRPAKVWQHCRKDPCSYIEGP